MAPARPMILTLTLTLTLSLSLSLTLTQVSDSDAPRWGYDTHRAFRFPLRRPDASLEL